MKIILSILKLLFYPFVAIIQDFSAGKEKRPTGGFVLAYAIGFASIALAIPAWIAGKDYIHTRVILGLAASILYLAGMLVFMNAMTARNDQAFRKTNQA